MVGVDTRLHVDAAGTTKPVVIWQHDTATRGRSNAAEAVLDAADVLDCIIMDLL
mgnify:CR=1 FL=1